MHRIIKAIRLLRPLGLATLTFALLITGACGTASAEVWTELPITAALPANGASLIAFPTAYPDDVTFAIESSTTGLIGSKVNIAAENAVNSNGRLFPEVRVEALYLKESERYPEIYAGYSPYEPWATAPGTYYWQFEGERLESVEKCFKGVGPEVCLPTSEWFNYLSPVYTLVITPKPSPPLPASPPAAPKPQPLVSAPRPVTPPIPLARAYADVKSIIRSQTDRPAHHLSDSCTFDSRAVTCQASWTSAWPRSSRTLLYAGTFELTPRSAGYQFSFSGRKKRYGCARGSGAQHCASNVHWRS